MPQLAQPLLSTPPLTASTAPFAASSAQAGGNNQDRVPPVALTGPHELLWGTSVNVLHVGVVATRFSYAIIPL
jgi:hypothetical protein